MQETYHTPALLNETIDLLGVDRGGVYVDVTFGGGGHSRAILAALGKDGRLIAFDQDSDAVTRVTTDPDFADKRFTIVHSNFRFLSNFLRYHGYGPDSIDGLLADLGVSFHHFDDAERGFSFRFDAPLDMRMNRNATTTAASVLADTTAERLEEIFRLYGEVRNSRRLAAAIVSRREANPIATVGDLLDIARPMINPRQEKKELACIFQALRIEVNNELDVLRSMLTQALRALKPGGRLAIITYHSLEDRLVKNFMRTGNFEGHTRQDFFGRDTAPLKPLSNKPVVPSEAEVQANPRSRSAKLRVAIKLPNSDGQ